MKINDNESITFEDNDFINCIIMKELSYKIILRKDISSDVTSTLNSKYLDLYLKIKDRFPLTKFETKFQLSNNDLTLDNERNESRRMLVVEYLKYKSKNKVIDVKKLEKMLTIIEENLIKKLEEFNQIQIKKILQQPNLIIVPKNSKNLITIKVSRPQIHQRKKDENSDENISLMALKHDKSLLRQFLENGKIKPETTKVMHHFIKSSQEAIDKLRFISKTT